MASSLKTQTQMRIIYINLSFILKQADRAKLAYILIAA